MGRVTVITDNDNTEEVNTGYVNIHTTTTTEEKLAFKIKNKMPSCLRAQPSKAATSWDVVATVDDETHSGAITKVSGKRVYFDPRFSNLTSPTSSSMGQQSRQTLP